MATATTQIQVTACDNELYILASTGAGSSEICHIKSGFNNPVNYTVVPQSILPKGAYTLIFVGINWGGPQAFKVTLTQSSGPPIILTAPAGSAIGANWTAAVPTNV